MKKIKNELLVVALFCFLVGVCTFGLAISGYSDFKTLPSLPATEETVNELKRLYVNSEFKYAPGLGVAFVFVGSMAARLYWRMRNMEGNKR